MSHPHPTVCVAWSNRLNHMRIHIYGESPFYFADAVTTIERSAGLATAVAYENAARRSGLGARRARIIGLRPGRFDSGWTETLANGREAVYQVAGIDGVNCVDVDDNHHLTVHLKDPAGTQQMAQEIGQVFTDGLLSTGLWAAVDYLDYEQSGSQLHHPLMGGMALVNPSDASHYWTTTQPI